MPTVDFTTIDVFTSTRFGGNPLAVIPDARGLSREPMQCIARDFNWSEVASVLPPKDAANTARVRILTPVSEIPFAGRLARSASLAQPHSGSHHPGHAAKAP